MKQLGAFKLLIPILLLFLLNFTLSQNPTLFLVGDSTMSDKLPEDEPEKGWGQMLPLFFNSNIKIENHAKNGRSTKSFIEQGLWNNVLTRVKSGDYVLIQFGHNDSKISDTSRYAEANSTFKTNLIRYVTEIRAKNGIPVLLTPVNRRKFDQSGNFVDQHGDYPLVIRAVAEEYDVPLIDLHEKSLKLFSGLGSEETKKIFLHVQPGLYSKFPEGKEDNTHFNEYGAKLIASLVVGGIRSLNLDLKNYLLPENSPVLK